MIRVVIENIVLFLLPTVVYALYVAATRGDTNKGILVVTNICLWNTYESICC